MGQNTRFKPGQSGNPKGRARGATLSKAIQDMLSDENFVDRLAAALPDDVKKPDPEFQGTPMKAIIATAIIEAMNPSGQIQARTAAREWIGKYGYGTKVDVTSDGQAIGGNPFSGLSVEELREMAQARRSDVPE